MAKSLCRCDCGAEKEVVDSVLRQGKTKSCGCLDRDVLIARNTKHGAASRQEKSITYISWGCMMNRCRSTSGRNKKHYVDRGITVCERWHSYENFLADMGERPSKEYSIERENVDGNYELSNCKWATKSEQLNNRTDSVKFLFYGIMMTVAEWAKISQIKPFTIYTRLNRGWPPQQAVWAPSGYYSKSQIKKIIESERA